MGPKFKVQIDFWLILLWIGLHPIPIAELNRPRVVVWNVGQGQWITWIQSQTCWHFDAGGEVSPLSRLKIGCHKKTNMLFLSHWDYDHISGADDLARTFGSTCLAGLPDGTPTTKAAQFIQKRIPLCKTNRFEGIEELDWFKTRDKKLKTNESSRVFTIAQRFLIPGDSPQNQEKKWIQNLRNSKQIKILVLGHHGSRTSTSETLLNHLPQLKLAIASSRKKKYGHPHAEIISRLRAKKIPTLRTEEWGNLVFEF